MMKMAIAAGLLLNVAPVMAQPHGQHGAHGQGGHSAPAQPARGENHAHAAQEDERAIMAVVDRMFAGLAARNPQAILAEVVPDGRATANTLDGNRRVNSLSWPQFLDHVGRIPGRPVERLIDPHVHVEGDIAMIWSRYEMEYDGRFLHCGIDHFDLIRQDGRWKVLNLTWTQQTQGCPGRGGPAGERG